MSKPWRLVTLVGILVLVSGGLRPVAAQQIVQSRSAQAVFERVFFVGDTLFGTLPEELAARAGEQLTGALAIASSTAPRLSSAGFSFSVDSVTGEPVLRTNSFGSVFVDRALTNGKGVWSLGFSYTQAGFGSIQGQSLSEGIPFYEERGLFPDGGEIYSRYVGTFDIDTAVAIASSSYGLTDRIDVSVTIPILRVQVVGEATRDYDVLRDYVLDPEFLDQFYPGGRNRFPVVRAEYSGTGLGDLGLATKVGLASGPRGGTAVVGEVRLPTGSRENGMGAGRATVRASFVGSARLTDRATFHANAGFMGGGVANGFVYATGIDQTLLPSSRLTVSLSVMGDVLADRPNDFTRIPVLNIPLNPADPRSREVTVSSWGFTDTGTLSLSRGAIGMKLNLGKGFLLVGSALIFLNDHGVENRVSPVIGIERVWGH